MRTEIRDFKKKDLKRIKELFDLQNFEYEFPDDDMSVFMDIQVIVDENDRVVMAVAAKPTADIYFFCDPSWETPGMRVETIKKLHLVMNSRLARRKIVQVHAWLPPSIEKSFGKRLMKTFGWTMPLWRCFARRIY